MKLINKTRNNLSHKLEEDDKTYFLAIGANDEIPNKIADIWLKIKGVEKYADPKDLEKLQKENEALKEQAKTKTQKESK